MVESHIVKFLPTGWRIIKIGRNVVCNYLAIIEFVEDSDKREAGLV